MIYYDDLHKEYFERFTEKLSVLDPFTKSAAYLLSLDTVLREHVNSVFDFDDLKIKPSSLTESYQTGTSLKTTRLLFNLWTGFVDEEDIRSYTP